MNIMFTVRLKIIRRKKEKIFRRERTLDDNCVG